MIKEDGFLGNSIDIGCCFALVAIATKIIGAAGIDTDKDNIMYAPAKAL